MTDMREAQRSYEANVNVIGASRRMIQRTHRNSQILIGRATMPTPSAAAQAYASLARIAEPMAAAKTAGESAAGPNFGAMLKEAVGALNAAARNSDSQTQAMAAGKANIVDVVTAVAETEVTIDALVSVRDKVISAYEEIMRMPI